ncbi:unnamed protein product, partial [Lampetra fluviatilis]
EIRVLDLRPADKPTESAGTESGGRVVGRMGGGEWGGGGWGGWGGWGGREWGGGGRVVGECGGVGGWGGRVGGWRVGGWGGWGGTRNVVRACVQQGVGVLVFTSSMEVVGPNIHGDPFYRGNEETRYRTLHAVAYPASKAEAERLVITASGTALGGGGLLRTVSLRPLGIYGEGHNVLESYYRRAGGRDGWLLRGVPEDVEHGRVYVGNVAWMHALALRALSQGREGVEGEVFYCYDDSPRWLHAPAFFLRLMGMINDALRSALALFGVSYIPLLTRYTVAMALTVFSVDTDKAARAFGYAPRYSWAQARDRTAAWIRSLDGGGDEADRKGK